jgi:DNA repair exonuclease SbcCD ATPase subunit
LNKDLRDDEAAEAAKVAEHLAFRREAVARLAAAALRATADRLTVERIDPLRLEVASRWKRLFGTGELLLNPNGTIERRVGTRTLRLRELSGGERIWAQLVVRMLLLGASSTASFAWLDEPLEHLDPDLRRIVAGTLAKAGGESLRQIVVLTYEEGLARQLSAGADGVRLLYVRPGDRS